MIGNSRAKRDAKRDKEISRLNSELDQLKNDREKEVAELKAELDQLKNGKRPKQVAELTLDTKLLILYYMGFFNAEVVKLEDTKLSEVLSGLLNKDVTNTRKSLGLIHKDSSELRSERNLEFVRDYFEKLGLQKHADRVEKDLILVQKRG